MAAVVSALLFATAAGHGTLTNPPPRTGQNMKEAGLCPGMWVPTPIGPAPRASRGHATHNGTCDWYSQGCQPGCQECNVKCGHIAAAFGRCCKGGAMPPTWSDPELRTYQSFGGLFDIGMRYNPWRAPGFAPVLDPCGVITGNQPGEHVDDAPKPGTRGSDLPPVQGPKWAAGSVQDVSWSLYANHGGGYAYRLCPKRNGVKLTEECFQQHHLNFVGNESWIQYGDNETNRTAIPAVRTVKGTNPLGSQWTKNPIPACAGYVGGSSSPFRIPFLSRCSKAQFDPPLKEWISPSKWAPLPGLYGFGVGSVGPVLDQKEFDWWTARFSFNIIDKVQIPANLPAGEYALSFRWDCEQTPQVWQQCADVTVTSSLADSRDHASSQSQMLV